MVNKYEILSEAPIADQRHAVVSKHPSGGFTVAQRLDVSDGNQSVNIYMKGALHVSNLGGLLSLRDALDEAIGKLILEQ